MNQLIEFKKDFIMKTMISEITDISLTHDYKVMEDMIEGYFDISGEYKITKASASREDFMFTVPFSIALSSLIDKSSINLTIKDFNYTIEKDVLHLKMALNMDYQEIAISQEIIEEDTTIEEVTPEEVIDEYLEDETNNVEDDMVLDTLEEVVESMPMDEEFTFHNELMIDDKSEVKNIEDKKEAEESIKSIISEMTGEESYYKYKVYIMREEDTIESVAIKYNVTLDVLREYNSLDNINVGDKIVIPFINVINEENK